MKNSNQSAQGIIAQELYQGLDLKALIGNTKEPVLSIQEQIELGIQSEKKRIKQEESSLAQTKEMLLKLAETMGQWEEKMQEELVAVIVEVVRNLIEVELVTNPEIIKKGFNKILKYVVEEEIQKVVINEADHAALVKTMGSELELVCKQSKMEFDVRSDVPRGTLTAQSKQLSIDAGVSEKIKRFLTETEDHN